MTAQPKHRMTVDEFLGWAARQSSGRYELVNGSIVVMSPERARHARVKANAWVALRDALQRADLACEAFNDGMTIIIDRHTSREPDAAVQCKPVDDESLVLDEPIIVVEVLSPTTSHDDHGAKLFDYASVASIRHYLILDPVDRTVIHYRRNDGGEPFTAYPTSRGSIALSPPGIAVDIADLFGAPT